MSDTFIGLIGALNGIPHLPGALCKGRAADFDEQAADEDDDDAVQRQLHALDLCRACPSLDACESWFLSLAPSKKPVGVIAGRIHRQPTPRQRRKDTA